MEGATIAGPRKIMVIADPGRESAGALQWALYHSVVEHDEMILLHVENTAAWRNPFATFLRRPSQSNNTFNPAETGGGGGDLEFLDQMKKVCETVQPKVKVQIERVENIEGKDKASVILKQSTDLSIDVLIVGQRRSLSNAILGRRITAVNVRGPDIAEYLIENSKCICVGVQKKGQNGGYVLNSKTHKNFWLLA